MQIPLSRACSTVPSRLAPVLVGLSLFAAAPVPVALAQNGTVTATISNASGTRLNGGAFWLCWGPVACIFTPSSTNGVYTLSVPPGTYRAFTGGFNAAGVVNEIHPAIPCPVTCDSTAAIAIGAPVVVTGGGAVTALSFTLDPGATLTGAVTDSVTGQPVQGVTVSLRTLIGSRNVGVQSATSNASGTYVVPGVPPGTYFAYTSAGGTGYVNEVHDDILCVGACSTAVAVNSGREIVVAAGAAPAPINFALTPGGRISGTVIDAQTLLPMAGVPVFAYTRVGQSTAQAGSASTNASGVYTIAGLPTGSYYLATSTTQAINEIYNGVICLDACSSADAVLVGEAVPVAAGTTTTGRDFQLDAGGALSGTVVAATGGAPIAGVQIVVYRQVGSAVSFASSGVTDATGAYTVRGLSTGPYFAVFQGNATLAAELSDGAPCLPCSTATILASQPIPVSLGATTPGIDFSLETAATITGRVTSAATSVALPGTAVGLYRSGVSSPLASTTADASGAYALTGLPPGTYYASVSGANHGGEVYNNVPCPVDFCGGIYSSANGTPIVVTAGATTSGIDFSVEPLTSAPAAPSGLNAAVLPGGVLFMWTPPAGGGAATSFLLEAGGSPGTTAAVLPAASTSLFVAGPPIGTFYVRVRAVNAAGTSPASAELTLRIGSGGNGLPGAPMNLVASMSGGRLTMTWSAPASGPLPIGYVVEAGSSGGLSNIAVVPVSTRSFVFDGVPPGFYFLRVRARTAAGDGPASAEAMIVVGLVATPPSPPLNLSHAVSGSTVTFTWQAPAAGTPTSYVLEAGSATGLSNIAVFDTGNANTAFVVNGVPPGAYYVRLRARSGVGTGLVSNERVVIVP